MNEHMAFQASWERLGSGSIENVGGDYSFEVALTHVRLQS